MFNETKQREIRQTNLVEINSVFVIKKKNWSHLYIRLSTKFHDSRIHIKIEESLLLEGNEVGRLIVL